MRQTKWRIHRQLVISATHWLPCIWPAETSNVNTASVQKKKKKKRERERKTKKRERQSVVWLHTTDRDGGMGGVRKQSQLKRLMDRFHSRESQDQCPPLAHVGQALSMRFTTYLPASALCDRKNIGQINTRTGHSPTLYKLSTTPSPLWEATTHSHSTFRTLHAALRGGQISCLGLQDKQVFLVQAQCFICSCPERKNKWLLQNKFSFGLYYACARTI